MNNKMDENINQSLVFPKGLFGFENYTQFKLFESEYEPFLWLQSTEKKDLEFLVVDPFLICSDYEIDIDDAVLSEIDVLSPADVFVLAIMTVPADGSPVTANLQGPIVVNKKNNKCIQVVLTDPKWRTKHNILEEMKKREEIC